MQCQIQGGPQRPVVFSSENGGKGLLIERRNSLIISEFSKERDEKEEASCCESSHVVILYVECFHSLCSFSLTLLLSFTIILTSSLPLYPSH